MAGYIKSHSNYRLQSRHQFVNNGQILERDISTIGGVNSFATGQATVYQSGNFVMVVNNGTSASRHVKKNGWLASGNNTNVWDASVLEEHSSDITGSVEGNIMLKNDFMDLRSFAYYGSLSNLIENTVSKILTTYPYEIYLNPNANRADYVSGSTMYEVDNPGGIDIHNTTSYDSSTDNGLGHFYNGGVQNYSIYPTLSPTPVPVSGYSFSWLPKPCSIEEIRQQNPNAVVKDKNGNDIICPTPGVYFSIITLSIADIHATQYIYAYWNESLEVKYCITTPGNGLHIRPKMNASFYEDFIDNLDLFGKCLMGAYSGIRNVAKFEILNETNTGVSKTVQTFTFPTDNGGYNLASDGIPMQSYIRSLGSIANRYDGYYTDNLYRLMTHDSLKNLDWTNGFNGEESEDNHYVKTGEKFAAVIRVMGYVFDQEKAYIDSIGNVNSITYSSRSNLSDYFLTDSLETDGWVINSVYPYTLTCYSKKTGNEVTGSPWTYSHQIKNQAKRMFSENTSEVIEAYNHYSYPHYTKLVSGDNGCVEEDVYVDGGKTYVSDGGVVYNVISDYTNISEKTVPEINNEFMKRLRINSKQLFRKKGTIDGIESLLSLFGLKSKRWFEAHKLSKPGSDSFDFDIIEYTTYAAYRNDEWDSVLKNYKINWYNSCKTIPYPTQSYVNGEYIDYQGLPVAYRDIEQEEGEPERRLYPYFSNNGFYDGGMYYQMNGGWLNYKPFRFDSNNDILEQSGEYPSNVETIRNVLMVNNLSELVEQPIDDLYNDIIYYVNNINESFALIDGKPYELKLDTFGESIEKYFDVYVYDSSVSIGDSRYEGILEVSNPYGDNGIKTYDLSLYSDGTTIRIYYKNDRENPFHIEAYKNVNDTHYQPSLMDIFDDGYYGIYDEDNSNYFQLSDVNGHGKIGDDYWKQIKTTDEIYQRIDTIVDNYEGNNPHSGNFQYDNGEEYINRFTNLFQYASDNYLFNESCFTDVEKAYEEIDSYGFRVSTIIPNDTKVHAFIDKYDENRSVTKYDINEKSSLMNIESYGRFIEYIPGGDGEPSQIINRKNIKIVFYIHDSSLYSKSAQEEIKYIQCKIMPYVEQMIPSTAIVEVEYVEN